MKRRDSEHLLCAGVHHRVVHSSREGEAAHVPMDEEGMNRVWCTHSSGASLSLERDGNSDTC